MGIIVKQSIKGTLWSYIGVGIGFVTTAYLFPNYLSTDTVGLFQLLLAWSAIMMQFSSLGFTGVVARIFPYFRNKEKGHNGFLFIAFMVMATGFGLFLVVYFLFAPWLAENNLEKSQLFSEYIYLLIPITFFLLVYTVFDSYNRLLYDSVFGIYLSEFFQRLLIIVVVLLFVFEWINLHQLIISYAAAVSAKGAVFFFYLLIKGEIHFRPKPGFITKELRNEMISVGFYSILTGAGGSIVFLIDKIMVNQILGLDATGVYGIAFFFGTLVIIPSRPLLRISGTLIAEAWKKNDISYIADIYKKSCLNQFIMGAFLFGGIWVNIESILIILGPDYASGEWVIFFIGIGYLIDMATGANGQIIAYSKYYRMALWFLIILIVLVVINIYLMVPIWGITGAALAIAVSFLLNNLMRFLFLYRKYRLQPFKANFLLIILIFLIAYGVGYLLPELPLVWDLLARGSIFAIVYLILIVGLRVSSDVNITLIKLLKQLGELVNKK
jgi:O-antigen/teichoic acid export membrane protein